MYSVLIVQLGLFGDCLYATTIARQIKNDYPNCKVIWAIWSKYKSVLINNPYVDEIREIEVFNNDYVSKRTIDNVLKETNSENFDKVIFSQIPNMNWQRYDGSIRSSILSAYPNEISVPASPILFNTKEEISKVDQFANKYQLTNFENVVLFECAPGSGQSLVDFDFAMELSKKLLKIFNNTCFILSSPNKFETESNFIIDASTLSFRENARLTHYCNLLIGCSSGLSWLSTSSGAKQLNTIQLLTEDYPLYTGMIYDAQKWQLPSNHIIEMNDNNQYEIEECLKLVLNNSFEKAKKQFGKVFMPRIKSFSFVFRFLLTKMRWRDAIRFTQRFSRLNETLFTKEKIYIAALKEIFLLPLLAIKKILNTI